MIPDLDGYRRSKMPACARFVGKRAIVTGGAQGIGSAICRRLYDEGAHVLAFDLVQVDDTQIVGHGGDNPGRFESRPVDVTDRSQIRAGVADLGHVDLIVNNAGIAGMERLEEIKPETWDAVLDLNLRAPVMMVQECMPLLQSGAAIVNVASIASLLAFNAQAAYAASKAGLVALTRNMAFELGGRGIRANAIGPGPTETPMFWEDIGGKEMEQRLARIPLGRMGRPEDMAAAVAFLGSDDAAYITGVLLLVDGGFVGAGIAY
jgi:NAD(P)-dependent dehydrogenase (short-subunit alcohol dehydrogenase family)